MSFVISRVGRRDFHSYLFHAVNDVGHTSHTVRLTHSHHPTTSSSGKAVAFAPDFLRISVFIVLFLLVLADRISRSDRTQYDRLLA